MEEESGPRRPAVRSPEMGRQAEGPGPAWGSLRRRRRSAWREALLAVVILSSCFLLTQAQETAISVTVEPSPPLEGQDLTLTPGGKPDFILCDWFRGEQAEVNRIFTYIPPPPASVQQNGPGFTGRETSGPNCSLSISGLRVNDTGLYIVKKTLRTGSETERVQIEVFERVSGVSITSRPAKAIEGKLLVLTCSSTARNVSYTWSKGDQMLGSGGHITLGDSSLTFSPLTRNDTGNYTCHGRNSFSNSSATHELEVFYGPDEPVISPPGRDYEKGSLLTLSCLAESLPPAQYTWLFNGTELLGTGPQLSIRSLSFDHEGNYTCSASNPETSSSSSASREIKVFEKLFPPTLRPADSLVEEHGNVTLNCTTSESSSVSVFWFRNGGAIPAKSVLSKRNRTLTISDISRDDLGAYTCVAWNPANSAMSNPSRIAFDSPSPSEPSGLSGGQIAGIVIGCLAGVALIAAVLYFALKSTASGRMDQHSSNGNIPSAPGHNQGVTDTKPTAGEEDIQYTTLAFNSSSPPQPSLGPTVPLESGTIYSVIKKK